MRPLAEAMRPWLYVVGGLLVGFLFLTEFALNTVMPVQIGLLTLAVAGLLGVLRRIRSLELWPLFVAAALVLPLAIDVRTAGLPRCGDVPAGIACFAGSRDLGTQLGIETVTITIAVLGAGGVIVRELRAARATDN